MMIRRFIAWIVSFFRRRKSIPVEPVAAYQSRPWLYIRRRVGSFGKYKAKTELAALDTRTPKGAHFILPNGGRLHRKDRDIIGESLA